MSHCLSMVERPNTETPGKQNLDFPVHQEVLMSYSDRTFNVSVAGSAGGQVDYVDQTTGFTNSVARLRSVRYKMNFNVRGVHHA